MPQSYSAIWIHIIWSTKNREPILNPVYVKKYLKLYLQLLKNTKYMWIA
jgi:REP element-mobilizing transposase RayT